MSQVGLALWTQHMGSLQVQQKPEAVEVPLDIIVARIPFLKRQPGRKLCLSRRFQTDRDGRDPNL